MNWEHILLETGRTFLRCGLIVASYNLSKSYAEEKGKGDWFDKIFASLEILGVAGVVALIVTAKIDIPALIVNLFILGIPSLFGIVRGFEIASSKKE